MLQRKVSVPEILNIPAGEYRDFELPTFRQVLSAKTLAYIQQKLNPRPDVARYSCKELGETEYKTFKVRITAVPKE